MRARFCANGHKYENAYEGDRFCPVCGAALTDDNPYKRPYGHWKVTTEGDCEGRSMKDLGTHEGYIDDIAKALKSRAFYTLHFEAVGTPKPPEEPEIPEHGSVCITLPQESGLVSSRNREKRAEKVASLFRGRPVEVEPSNFYTSVKITW